MDRSESNFANHPHSGDMTRLMDEAAKGRSGALDELFPLVYAELRAMAGQRMASERADHTLEPTALVHEAYVRLASVAGTDWQSRGHFFFSAAEAMRRILIDHARGRLSLKRGKGHRREMRELEGLADLAANSDLDEILAVDAAVSRLEQQNPEVASVVRLRFYAGLSPEETASATGLSPRTVFRHWAYARAWLYRELTAKA